MNVSSSPSITFMLQYTEPNVQYVDYTNRDEAVKMDSELNLEIHRQNVKQLTEEQIQKIQNEVPETQLNFEEYIDYMNRSYATEEQTEEATAIFTENANYLQRSKVSELKSKLEQAYQNGSLLWQGVISFDNDFLATEGLYDLETGQVDQQTIKTVIREALPRMIKKEGLSDSSFWWANIHLNTDNIHVHFGLSEVNSNREKIFYQPRGRMEFKGNFSQKTIERLKSDVFHGLLNEKSRENLIRREQILANLKTNLVDDVFRENMIHSSAEKNFLEQAYNHLPLTKKWRYASNARDFAVSKFFLDRYLDSYLENEGKELHQKFLKETREFLNHYKSAYSAEKNFGYKKTRKIDGRLIHYEEQSKGYDIDQLLAHREFELRERLANTILRTFREKAPQIVDFRLEKNLTNFSDKNQELIRKQFPNATILKSLKNWEKLGYSLKKGEQPIEIIKPVYATYDKYGKGIGRPEFVKDIIYDVSQMEENLLEKQLTLKELSFLSSDELRELVDAAKKKDNRSLKERQELGTFRYALKLSYLEERQSGLLVRQRLLNQVQPLETDQPFVAFKQEQLAQELKLIELQFTPNYKLNEEEIALKQVLGRQFQDSVNISIDRADEATIGPSIRQLQGELATVNQLQDDSILMLLKGYPISKKEYVDELQTKVSIFQLKHQIYARNHKIAQSADEAVIKELRRENVFEFSKLNKLYKKLLPEEESQQRSQLAQTVSKQMQERKQLKKQNVQQSYGKAFFNTDFMKNLTSSLNSAQRANTKALVERERSDARQEQEERENSL